MQASFAGQFYSHIERSNDSSSYPSSSIGCETGLRSVCTNSIFFTHPDATNINEHVNIIFRKNPDSDDHSYLFQLLDEYEANLSSINVNIGNMEKLIFDEFMVIAMAQVQEVVSLLFTGNSSLLLEMTAIETRAVLYFFYATGLLIGVGIRNGAPMHLQLPSVFYNLIGSIAETKKVASFHSMPTDDNYNLNMIATCALTMRLGLSSVFPEAALNIFDSNDIKAVLMSTSSILSPYFLQTRAQYDGMLPTDVHIEIFWNSVRSLTKKKLIALLKKIWKGHQLPEYVYYESHSENGQLPAPLIIKPPTALGMLTPDNADIVVLTSGSISIPNCTNNKYMMDKLLEFIRN